MSSGINVCGSRQGIRGGMERGNYREGEDGATGVRERRGGAALAFCALAWLQRALQALASALKTVPRAERQSSADAATVQTLLPAMQHHPGAFRALRAATV